MNSDLVKYYKERAKEYEKIYDKPERQHDIQKAGHVLKGIFRNKEVLEIACGTGFWTERIAAFAKHIHATDINQEVLDNAAQKTYVGTVILEVADIFNFQLQKKYESLFGGFIWSHIPRQNLKDFFATINSFVNKDGLVVLMDNNYVEGSNHPVASADEFGNTYQIRQLSDGSSHRVLKNFAEEKE